MSTLSNQPLMDIEIETINDHIFKYARWLFVTIWFVVFIEPILLVIATRILTTPVYNTIWFITMTVQPFIAIGVYIRFIRTVRIKME